MEAVWVHCRVRTEHGCPYEGPSVGRRYLVVMLIEVLHLALRGRPHHALCYLIAQSSIAFAVYILRLSNVSLNSSDIACLM